jgi:single-stranded-DNA-specific exonuclease
LPDIDKAADRICHAVRTGEHIILNTDFDADGLAGSCVLMESLGEVFRHPLEKLHHITGHRLRDGYGVSDTVAQQIIDTGLAPALVITADQGANDHARIAKLADAQYVTIITDHHEMESPPAKAYACVSPARADSLFPDPHIAGAHVAWLVCCAVRQRLIDAGWLPRDTPSLAHLLDIVAVATVADCTDARSKNNRAVIQHGVKRMNAKVRPAWRAIQQVTGRDKPFDEEAVGWTIGPMVNAASRVDEARPALRWMLAKDDVSALQHAARLKDLNQHRRQIELSMRQQAMAIAARQVEYGYVGLVVALEEGHAGVHGITASRVASAMNRPTVCFSPKPNEPGILTGSVRSIRGVDVRQALAAVAHHHPEVQIGWGGHAAAAGTRIATDQLGVFTMAFDNAIREQLPAPGPAVIYTDGPLETPQLCHIEELNALRPYGKEFDPPMFTLCATIQEVKPVGDGSHLKLRVLSCRNNQLLDAIWFGAVSADGKIPVRKGDEVHVAFIPEANSFRGKTTLQLVIHGLDKVSECQMSNS